MEDSEKLKTDLVSGTASLLSKSTQNLSSCIKEETNEWEDEMETPRKSLNRDFVPYEKLSSQKELELELDLNSSESELDFLDQKESQEGPRGDLEEIIKSASDMTRNRRDQFFQSLNSIHLLDTLDREEEVQLYTESRQEPAQAKEEEPKFGEGEGSFLKKIKNRRKKIKKLNEKKEQVISQNKRKSQASLREDLERNGEIDIYSPKKAEPKIKKKTLPTTPLRKKKSFRDFLRTKKKHEHEKIIHIDLRPKNKPKNKQSRDFSDKIKAWNQMARAGAGIR